MPLSRKGAETLAEEMARGVRNIVVKVGEGWGGWCAGYVIRTLFETTARSVALGAFSTSSRPAPVAHWPSKGFDLPLVSKR
jgi:hypothetical protein